jgi:hypothetical protein
MNKQRLATTTRLVDDYQDRNSTTMASAVRPSKQNTDRGFLSRLAQPFDGQPTDQNVFVELL